MVVKPEFGNLLSAETLDSLDKYILISMKEPWEIIENKIKSKPTYLEFNYNMDIENLDKLFLSANQLKEISGLETLKNLETLDLMDNQIEKIKGLESLMNLKDLYLKGNQIPQDIIEDLGGLDISGCANEPLNFVKHSLVNL